MSGFRVPGFELGEPLGMDDLGMVFDAREAGGGGRRSAVRVVSASPFFEGTDGARRFLDEAEGLSRLAHPAAARTYAFGLTEDPSRSPYLAAEYVEGPTLAGSMGLPPDEKVGALIAVLEGLSYAHVQDVPHLFVRPSRIRLRPSGGAALLGYGLGYLWQAVRDRTYPAWLLDALSYAPPEAQAKPRRGTPRHDVYSCAMTLFEALAGEKFDPRRPRRLSEFSRDLVGLDHVVDRALDSERRRYPDAESFAADLREWLVRRSDHRAMPDSPKLEVFEDKLLDEKLQALEAAGADQTRRDNVRSRVVRWHTAAAAAGLEAFKDVRRRLDEAGMAYGFEALRHRLTLTEEPGLTPYFAVLHPSGKRRLVFASCPDWTEGLPGRDAPVEGVGGVQWLGWVWLAYLEDPDRPGDRSIRGIVCCGTPEEDAASLDPEVSMFRDAVPGDPGSSPARLADPRDVYEYLTSVALSAL